MKKRTISLSTLVTVLLAGAVGIGWLGLGLLSGYHGYFAVGVLSLLGALVWWVRGFGRPDRHVTRNHRGGLYIKS